jgi:hypothetical protein
LDRTGVTDLQHQIVWHFIAFPHMLLVVASREFIAKMRGRRVRCITWAGAAIASNEFGVNANVTIKLCGAALKIASIIFRLTIFRSAARLDRYTRVSQVLKSPKTDFLSRFFHFKRQD